MRVGKLGDQKKFSGFFDCLRTTWVAEGMSGVQRGLSISLARQFITNIFKLGLYEHAERLYHPDRDKPAPISIKFLAGATTGSISAVVANPLEILKVRMQSQSSVASAAVGYQHNFSGVRGAFRNLLVNEGLLQGLYKGVGTSILRQSVGGGTQLAVYHDLKERALLAGIRNGSPLHLGCSLAASVAAIAACNPLDVVRTRVYNQPCDDKGIGLYYRNGPHAAWKIVTVEGPLAFYKGVRLRGAVERCPRKVPPTLNRV